MGKATNKEIVERQKKVFNYIRENGTATTDELMQFYKNTQSTLIDDINILQKYGYPIDHVYYGKKYIWNKEKANQKDIYSSEFEEPINNTIIRRWILLYAINVDISTNGGPTQFKDITNILKRLYSNLNSGVKYSDYTLREDLRELVKDGYIQKSKKKLREGIQDENHYNTTINTPRLLPIDKELATRITTKLNISISSKVFSSFQKSINNIFPGITATSGDSQSSVDKAIDTILKYIQEPYETQCMSFTYLGDKRKIYYFQTCFIYYSTETGNFYLLGSYQNHPDSSRKKKTEKYEVFKANMIDDIKCEKENNTLFINGDNNDTADYFDMLFGAGIDNKTVHETTEKKIQKPEIHETEIHFKYSEQNEDKIKLLAESRRFANYSIESDKIIYTDTILGLTSFTHFLRGFDGEIIEVKKPPILKSMLQDSLSRKKNRYELVFKEKNINYLEWS